MRLRVGDVFDQNGREVVVYAKTFHRYLGVEARIAYTDRLDYGGVVITAHGPTIPPVKRRDLAMAAHVNVRLAWGCYDDAKRSRKPENKALHRERATKFERRAHWLRRLAGGES